MKIFIIAGCLIITTVVLGAEPEVNRSSVEEILNEITDDSYKGREAGTH